MFVIAYFVVGLTVLSISAIATNGAVREGGAYCILHLFLININNPLTPNLKFKKTPKFLFCKILKNKQYAAKVLLKRLHLNGHTM